MRVMRVAVIKSGVQAYRGRKQKKREYRALHTIKLNAGLRELGTTYSRFIDAASKKEVVLNRKVLSQIAENYPEILKAILLKVK